MRFHKSLIVALAFVASFFFTVAAHAQGAAPAAVEKTLRDTLPKYLGTKHPIRSISVTPIAGIFEIQTDENVFYSDAKGEYLLIGNMMDNKGMRNLTQERVNKLTAINFGTLPVKDGFQIVKGSGARKLVIFEDPNCGFCKRLEKEFKDLKDVTITILLYPVLGKDSMEKSKAIWCSADQAKAWDDWMSSSKKPSAKSCDTGAIDRNLAFGDKHRINGTPTLIFEDGTRGPGYMTAADINRRMEIAQTAKK